MPGKLILLPVRDNLTSQGISVQVRENLTLSKKSEGGDISLKLNMFHWQNIVSRNQTTTRYRVSYKR